MKAFKYFVVAMGLMALAACKKDNYYLYKDIARIQFGPDISRIYLPSYNLVDTLKSATFYYSDPSVTLDTVYFDIYAIGGTSTQDRPFKLQQVQVNGAINAVAGTHYKAFTDPDVSKSLVIKAGAVHAFVPVVLMRDPSLKTDGVVLKFNVVANESFQLGEMTNLWRKVQFSDKLSQPSAWDASGTRYYYGKYSVVKHKFMIDNTGKKWDQDFMVGLPADYSQLQYWTGVLKTALINYNNAHPGNMLRDEFGELVIFP